MRRLSAVPEEVVVDAETRRGSINGLSRRTLLPRAIRNDPRRPGTDPDPVSCADGALGGVISTDLKHVFATTRPIVTISCRPALLFDPSQTQFGT